MVKTWDELKLGVIVCTYNRREFLKGTIESLRSSVVPFDLVVVDNWSDDGTLELCDDYLRRGVIDVLLCPENKVRWFTIVALIGVEHLVGFMGRPPDVLLLSGDDYLYRSDWAKVLFEWYSQAPDDVALLTLDFEPEWEWNEVFGVLDVSGYRALVRKSAPGANWCFRWVDWLKIAPEYYRLMNDPLLDHKICRYLRNDGKRICALELCEHVGALESKAGNRAYSHARPLDRKKWGI